MNLLIFLVERQIFGNLHFEKLRWFTITFLSGLSTIFGRKVLKERFVKHQDVFQFLQYGLE